MSKHLITILGLIAALGVLALGVALVALPLSLQVAGVDAQTASVAQTNAIYEAELDRLREEQENLDEIDASVDALRAQIPSTGNFDDIFELIGRAADASGVTLRAATAGDLVAFVPRTEAGSQDAAAAQGNDGTGGQGGNDGAGGQATGRLQSAFAIRASAGDMDDATAFLDALRAGPRLLNNITATAASAGDGTVELQVTALAYVENAE